MKLFNRLLMFSIPVVLCTVAGLGYIIYSIQQDKLLANVNTTLSTVADLKQARIVDHFSFVEERLQAFNSRLLIRSILAAYPNQAISTEQQIQLDQILKQTQNIVTSFDSIHLIATDGVIVSSTEEDMLGQRFEQQDLLTSSQAAPVIGQFTYSTQNVAKLMHVISLSFDNAVVGYLAVSNDASEIYQILIPNQGASQSAESYLVEKLDKSTGRYLSPLSKVDNSILNNLYFNRSSEALINNLSMLYNRTDTIDGVDYAGDDVIATTRLIPQVNWGLVVKVDRAELDASFAELVRATVYLGLGILVLVCALCIFFSKGISKPLAEMAKVAGKIEKGDLKTSFAGSVIYEVAVLSKVFNKMTSALRSYNEQLEKLVDQRTEQLAQTNEDLRQSLFDLKQAQQRLIETEKMASLGGLVAGVAHEVNSPLGVSLSAATYFQDVLSYTQSQFDNQRLTEDDFDDLMRNSKTSMDIIVNTP